MGRASRAFGVAKVEDEPPPLRARSSFQARPIDARVFRADALVHVYLAPDVFDALARDRSFSRDVEEGGFLFGEVFRDADAGDRWIAVITEAAPAEHASGSREELLFSADSFASARERLEASAPPLVILGWYHTHLLSSNEEDALSLVDRDLHFTTFRKPFQIALLVSLDLSRDPEGRSLSVYARRGDFMARCALEVLA